MTVVWKDRYGFRRDVYSKSLFFAESYNWHDFKFFVFNSYVESVEEALILGDISKVEDLTNMKFDEVLSYIENSKDFKISSLTSEVLGSVEKPLQDLVNEALKEIKEINAALKEINEIREDQIVVSKADLKYVLETTFSKGWSSPQFPGDREEVIKEMMDFLEDDDEW